MKYRNDKSASDLKDTPLPRYEEGESLSRIWVVRSLGIDPASGDEILLKRNGEMTSAVNWSANDVVLAMKMQMVLTQKRYRSMRLRLKISWLR